MNLHRQLPLLEQLGNKLFLIRLTQMQEKKVAWKQIGEGPPSWKVDIIRRNVKRFEANIRLTIDIRNV